MWQVALAASQSVLVFIRLKVSDISSSGYEVTHLIDKPEHEKSGVSKLYLRGY